LFGAMDSGRLPDDRSFTYSLLIRGLVRPFDSLWALLWWQTAAGIAVAAIAWHLMVVRLAVPRRIAFAGACLLAIEPAQLYYERMVLAETFGLLGFALFCLATAAYLASGRGWWLPVVALTGLGAATLRLNYIPVVLVISVAAPLLRRLAARPRWTHTLRHGVVAVACVAASHGGFQQWVAFIFKSPPGYIARAGFMQLALVLPLVKPHHLEQVGLPADFATQLRFPLDDPDVRMSHQWAPGGFIRTLRERGTPIEPVARPLARMALRDDPLGLVRLGVHTAGNYFRADGIAHARSNDLGRRVIPNDVLWTLREIWHYDASNLWTRTTPISRYFEVGSWWLVVCLFAAAPLALAVIVRRWHSPERAQVVFVGLVTLGLVAAHILFVPVAFYRYLHPLPFFVIVCGCLLRAQAPRVRPTSSSTSTPTPRGTTDRPPSPHAGRAFQQRVLPLRRLRSTLPSARAQATGRSA
jgi:hypothetical protein